MRFDGFFSEIAIFSVEDLEQEVWCRAFERQKDFKTTGIFCTWVYRLLSDLMSAGANRKSIADIKSESQLEEAKYNKYQNIVYGITAGE